VAHITRKKSSTLTNFIKSAKKARKTRKIKIRHLMMNLDFFSVKYLALREKNIVDNAFLFQL